MVSVSIQEQKDNKNEATLTYEYDIIELPENIELDEEFDNFLGDIVFDILETQIENNPNELKINNEN